MVSTNSAVTAAERQAMVIVTGENTFAVNILNALPAAKLALVNKRSFNYSEHGNHRWIRSWRDWRA